MPAKPVPGASQYLLALYRAEQQTSDPVAPAVVADTVDVSPSAAAEMLRRLTERGFVSDDPDSGAVSLTPDGRETAASLQATQAILSRLFDAVLDLDDPDTEAMRLAGTVSPAVADRLGSTLFGVGTRAEPTVSRRE
jgi:Mn-dependent DtxR family transcriptional regulator